ncbi:MAG TPA: hypothetical protein PKG95_01165 [Anaerolineaceae bacterium]|nr:hypothetical protein [Anaerolineaceae bacterium]
MENILKLDALPQRIEANESYAYEIYLGANNSSQMVARPDNPGGTIRVHVPYDGNTSLPIRSAMTICNDLSQNSILTPETAHIGWLAVSKPRDWQAAHREVVGLETMEAVRIPLKGDPIILPEDWISDRLCAVSQLDYRPAPPRYFPVSLDLQIWDSASDHSDFDRRIPGGVSTVKSGSELLRILDAQMLQGGALMIDLEISVTLPADISPEELTVKLKKLEINWLVVPDTQELYIIDQDRQTLVDWWYNPEQGTIEASNVLLTPRDPVFGSNMRPYRVNLSLILRQASRVVLQGELSGCLQLEAAGLLLSGRQVAWMDVIGNRRDEHLYPTTTFRADFEADLNSKFLNRKAAIYRQWAFPGVAFSPARLNDVLTTLSDLGYQVKQNEIVNGHEATGVENSPTFARISGTREVVRKDQPPVKMILDVWMVRLHPSQTEHEVTDERGTVRTTLITSDLYIQVRGWANCSGSLLAADMDHLMALLKPRLLSIATNR